MNNLDIAMSQEERDVFCAALSGLMSQPNITGEQAIKRALDVTECYTKSRNERRKRATFTYSERRFLVRQSVDNGRYLQVSPTDEGVWCFIRNPRNATHFLDYAQADQFIRAHLRNARTAYVVLRREDVYD